MSVLSMFICVCARGRSNEIAHTKKNSRQSRVNVCKMTSLMDYALLPRRIRISHTKHKRIANRTHSQRNSQTQTQQHTRTQAPTHIHTHSHTAGKKTYRWQMRDDNTRGRIALQNVHERLYRDPRAGSKSK